MVVKRICTLKLVLAGFGCAVALLAVQAAPLYAQDDLDEAGIVVDPATTSEGLGEVVPTSTELVAALKADAQAEEAFIPDESVAPSADDKRFLFMPFAAAGISSTAAEEGGATEMETAAYWRNIKVETFEGLFPSGKWRTYDYDGAVNGSVYWDDTSYRSNRGSWSAWAARGGANGVDPRASFYPDYMRSWMVYGPFSLRYALAGRVVFRYWLQSERSYDYFWWVYSCDGVNFRGWNESGGASAWRTRTMNIPCGRDSSVWIGFVFNSDYSVRGRGAYVDDIYIQQYR